MIHHSSFIIHHSKRGAGARGFSLVEIVVVMAIMAVLVAIAVPNFNKILARHQLDTATRQLAADLRETRERAMTEREDSYKITFNTTNESYCIKKGTLSLRTIELPHQVDMYSTSFGGNEVKFDILSGAPTPAGGVVLKNRLTGESRQVFVALHTGRVRIE